MEQVVQAIAAALTGICPPYVIVFLISMIPILELRGAILVALPILQTKVWLTYIVAVLGNMLPIPFILIFILRIFEFLKRFKYSAKVVNWLESKALSKSDQIHKYGKWGLFIFVAIPLPGTGAWTGSLLAALLGFKPKEALPYIFAGVCTAGIIMSIVGYGLGALIN